MNKLWVLLLIVIFLIGFGVKSYILTKGESNSEPSNSLTASQVRQTEMFGRHGKVITPFDKKDNRIRIVYFGFTRCPDVCPTSLAVLSSALKAISDTQKQQIRPLFISLDPERDAPDASHQYAQYFHSHIEGLSAPLAITKPLATHYGVVFKKTELAESGLGYTLDHNSYFYFLRPDGSLITKVPHTVSSKPLIDTINQLLNPEENTVKEKGSTS